MSAFATLFAGPEPFEGPRTLMSAEAAPAVAERLAAQLADPRRRALRQRRIRLSIGAIVVSLLAGAASAAWLLTGVLAPPADAFALLCVVLAIGVFLVSEMTLLGSLVSHMAMQRYALGQKDIDVFEATQELEIVCQRVEALTQLAERHGARPSADVKLLADSMTFIRLTCAGEPVEALEASRAALAMRWKAKGADEALLAKLTI